MEGQAFSELPLSTRRQILQEEAVAMNFSLVVSSTKENELLSQERGLEVDTTLGHAVSQTVLLPSMLLGPTRLH